MNTMFDTMYVNCNSFKSRNMDVELNSVESVYDRVDSSLHKQIAQKRE
jgi:hypothetical protein